MVLNIMAFLINSRPGRGWVQQYLTKQLFSTLFHIISIMFGTETFWCASLVLAIKWTHKNKAQANAIKTEDYLWKRCSGCWRSVASNETTTAQTTFTQLKETAGSSLVPLQRPKQNLRNKRKPFQMISNSKTFYEEVSLGADSVFHYTTTKIHIALLNIITSILYTFRCRFRFHSNTNAWK